MAAIPAPTRIEAILVPRVLCNKAGDYNLNCFVPDRFGPFPLPSGTTATAVIQDTACQIIGVEPPTGGEAVQQRAIVLVAITFAITLVNFYGVVIGEFTCTKNVVVTVPVCGSVGLGCQVTSALLVSDNLVNTEEPFIELAVSICLTVTANACLLVPSYGFCVTPPCQVLPSVCPPAPPAQCF